MEMTELFIKEDNKDFFPKTPACFPGRRVVYTYLVNSFWQVRSSNRKTT